MPVKHLKSKPDVNPIQSRVVPRKSRRIPPAPEKFLIPGTDAYENIDEVSLLERKKQAIQARLDFLANLEAQAKAERAIKEAEAKEAAEAQKKTNAAKAKPTKASASDRQRKASSVSLRGPKKRSKNRAAEGSLSQAEGEKTITARTAKVPRRQKIETPKRRGRKVVQPIEEVVTVSTGSAKKKKKSSSRARKKEAQQDSSTPEATTLIGNIPPYNISSDEPYMSEPQLVHFRTILTAQLEDLTYMIEKTLSGMQEEPTIQADPLDQAHREASVEIEMRTRERERRAIRKIQESIALIEKGTYGYCKSCNDEIGIRRLEARPTATKCIECKNIDEMEESRYS